MGRNPATVKRVIIDPDWVLRVICHIIAYCTTIVPKRDKACPTKNNAVFFFQLMFVIILYIILVLL
jgi:hypothetical protein